MAKAEVGKTQTERIQEIAVEQKIGLEGEDVEDVDLVNNDFNEICKVLELDSEQKLLHMKKHFVLFVQSKIANSGYECKQCSAAKEKISNLSWNKKVENLNNKKVENLNNKKIEPECTKDTPPRDETKLEKACDIVEYVNIITGIINNAASFPHVPYGGNKFALIKAICYILEHPDITPEESHQRGMDDKIDDGGKLGPVKDGDKKETPLLVPFDQLPLDQQAKNYLFKGIVLTLSNAKFK